MYTIFFGHANCQGFFEVGSMAKDFAKLAFGVRSTRSTICHPCAFTSYVISRCMSYIFPFKSSEHPHPNSVHMLIPIPCLSFKATLGAYPYPTWPLL